MYFIILCNVCRVKWVRFGQWGLQGTLRDVAGSASCRMEMVPAGYDGQNGCMKHKTELVRVSGASEKRIKVLL